MTDYFTDDFEAYTVGNFAGQVSEWSLYETTVGMVKISDTIKRNGLKSCYLSQTPSPYGEASIHTLLNYTGIKWYRIPVYFTAFQSDSTFKAIAMYIAISNKDLNNTKVYCGVDSNGFIWYHQGTTYTVTSTQVVLNTWYDFDIKVDWTAEKYSIYLEHELIKGDISFATNVVYIDETVLISTHGNEFYVDDVVLGNPKGALENVSSSLVSLIQTDLQKINSNFKVRVGYPHEASQIPYGVYVNIIDMSSDEFGLGQRYKTNLIQLRKILARISVWTPRKVDSTLYSDGTGLSSEQLYLDRIVDIIQRLLITERDLDTDCICDSRLRGVSPLLFDENLNAFNKTMSYEIEYEELFEV